MIGIPPTLSEEIWSEQQICLVVRRIQT